MSDDKLRNKLNRFDKLLGGRSSAPDSSRLPGRYRKLADSVRGEIRTNNNGAYCLVRNVYPFNYIHGKSLLEDAVIDSTLPLAAFTAQDQRGELPVASMLFLDTETTGLGGVGTVAFLVGCGSLTADGFEVRQYLLPDYTDEAAMLEDVLEEFGNETSLVSYNGAAFDLPVLRDRMIVNRVSKDIDRQHHIDLLHGARRLFRRRLQDCRLTNIESQLFGFGRTDDIPGYLIPSAYFEWLSTEDTSMMPGILEHNRLDIVSLYFLLGHVAKIYQSRGEALADIDDLHSLSKLFGRRKESDLVGQVFDRMDQLSDTDMAEDILFYHSMNFKRTRDFDRAVEMWESICQSDSRESYWANIELAKYFEHRGHDLKRAYSHARRAQTICPYGRYQQDQLKNRIRRLAGKLKG